MDSRLVPLLIDKISLSFKDNSWVVSKPIRQTDFARYASAIDNSRENHRHVPYLSLLCHKWVMIVAAYHITDFTKEFTHTYPKRLRQAPPHLQKSQPIFGLVE